MNINASNYRKETNIYGGCAVVTPLMFNPTAEDIKRIKGLPDTVEIKQPEYYKEIKNKNMRKISLLCEIDPTKQNPKGVGEKSYVNIEFYMNNDEQIGSSGKALVMDNVFNTAWITPVKGKSMREVLNNLRQNKEVVKQDDRGNDIVKYTCPDTKTEYWSYDKGFVEMVEKDNEVRVAKYGEHTLLSLLFNMTNLSIPSTKAKNNAREKFEFSISPDKYKAIYDGDNVILNSYLLTSSVQNDAIGYFTSKGKQNPVGVFLYGGKSSDGTKLYQNAYTPFVLSSPSPAFFKAGNETKLTTFKGVGYELPFGYGNDYAFLKTIKDATYPLDGVYPESMLFSIVTLDETASTTITTEESKPTDDDDLPF